MEHSINPKRIVIFSLAYDPFIGGAEVAIAEIAKRIPKEALEFHLITARFDSALPEKEPVGPVMVYRVGPGRPGVRSADIKGVLWYGVKALYPTLAAFKALSLHRSLSFDGAWAMMSYMVLPLMLMRLAGVSLPYALTLQEGDPFRHVFGRMHFKPVLPLLRWGFRSASVVQAISTFLGRWAGQLGFTGPLEIIPNGVDVSAYQAPLQASRRLELRDAMDARDGGLLLITTSRLVAKNAIGDVIRALPLLPESVTFAVLGTGPLEHKLRALAKEEGVSDRVSFLGEVRHADVAEYVQAADVFVRPSLSEGMGISFIEAMAAGLPVIGTLEGGIADFLVDAGRAKDGPLPQGATGFAVAARSPKEIAETVAYIERNLDRARRVGQAAKAYVEGRYDWARIAQEMREKVFSRLGKS